MNQRDPKRRILIVEDDPSYRDSLAFMFGDFQFLQAGTVPEALDLLRDNPDVQVVILDLQLGGAKGTALLEALKDRIENYRVIVLTAFESLLGANEAAAYGVFSYVVKTDSSFREALLFHINDAFTAIENAWLGRKVDAHLEIVRKVNRLDLGANDNADQDLKEVLELICDHALGLLGAYTCHIRLLDPGRGDFVLWATKARTRTAGTIFATRVPPNQAYSALAAETGERIDIPNLQVRPEFIAMKADALKEDAIDPAFREYLDEVRSARIDPISTGIFGVDIDAVFNINSDVVAFFSTPKKQELVDDFVTQTNLAVTKYRFKKKRIDLHDDYRNIGDMLGEISSVLIAGEDQLENIYKIAFNRIARGIGPEIISIFLYDDTLKQLKNVAEYRGDKWVGAVDEQYRSAEAIVGRVYSDDETQIFATKVDELTGALDYDSVPEGYEEEKIEDIPSGQLRHYLAVPIKFNNITIGVMRAVNKKSEQYDSEIEKRKSICLLKRGFSADCRTELEITASHLAATIKNAELIGELNETVNQLESINKVGEMIGFGQDMDAAFDLIVQSAVEIMHAEICMLFRMNKEGDRIYLTQSSGMPLIEGAFYEVGEGTTGGVAKDGKMVLEEQARSDHIGKYEKEIVEFLRKKHGTEDQSIASFMAVPLKAKGRILGVIKVINKVEPPFHFEKKDAKLFQLFDSQIGLERFLYTQRYLENLVDHSPLPIIYLNKKGKVEIFNKACEELWGYSSKYAIGKSVVNFYVSENQAREIGKKLWESENNRIHDFRTEIKASDGRKIPVVLSATILFDDEERRNRIGSMGVFKDLQEIERYQDQAQRTEWDAIIGRRADSVSHAVINRLSQAKLDLDTLKARTDKHKLELSTEYVNIGDALEAVRDELIALTRSPEPSQPEQERISVNGIFEAPMFESLSREARRRDADFDLSYANVGQTLVDVDLDQIKEVFKNLFNNSLDAIKRRNSPNDEVKGSIEVSASRPGDLLELIWRDNGCGIPEANLDKVFQLYFTYGKPKGTGWGLYRAWRIIDNHGGSISVTSVEGEGATFTLTLPVSSSER